MNQSTCSYPECERTVQRREWCNAHYRRKLKAGEISGRTGVCTKCGDSFNGPKAGPMIHQCPACRREIRLADGRRRQIESYVRVVNMRTCRDCGVIYEAPGRDTNSIRCSTCRREAKNALRRKQRVIAGAPAATPSQVLKCLTCGNTDKATWRGGRRSFCSDTCRVTWRKYKGDVPKSFDCAACGIEVQYFDPKTRRRIRSDAAYCSHCVREARTYTSAVEIAAEDGTDCKLCGLPVDMEKVGPVRGHPSVDHIVPRALGGDDSRENLTLAHRGCNSAKRHYYTG